MAYLTDGFVPEWYVKDRPKGLALAKRLVAAELWQPGESAGETGFWYHDWKPENLKVNVLAARERARQRKAKSRESQGESQGPSRVTHTSRHASVTPSVTVPTPTHTNPTQPISNSLVDSSGGVTSVDAPVGHTPRPHCSKHHENSDTACLPCKKRREWDEAQAEVDVADELEAKRLNREARENCTRCHGTNTYEDNRGHVRKCFPHLDAEGQAVNA